eukprot:s4830_g4.t1
MIAISYPRLEDEDADVRAAASQATGLLSNSVDDVRLLAPLLKAKKRKLKCCCRRKKGAAQRKSRTGIEDESRMMRWRVLNKEGFLQALFVLGDERKRRRKGDQLLITADVMAEKGVHVATFKGKMQADAMQLQTKEFKLLKKNPNSLAQKPDSFVGEGFRNWAGAKLADGGANAVLKSCLGNTSFKENFSQTLRLVR